MLTTGCGKSEGVEMKAFGSNEFVLCTEKILARCRRCRRCRIFLGVARVMDYPLIHLTVKTIS
jgi:hypothetical protein